MSGAWRTIAMHLLRALGFLGFIAAHGVHKNSVVGTWVVTGASVDGRSGSVGRGRWVVVSGADVVITGASVVGACVVGAGGAPQVLLMRASMHAWNNSPIPQACLSPLATSTPQNHIQRKMIGPASNLTSRGNSNSVLTINCCPEKSPKIRLPLKSRYSDPPSLSFLNEMGTERRIAPLRWPEAAGTGFALGS